MEAVYIDSNIWNFLHDEDIDLSEELPSCDFKLFIAGEQVFENKAIPETKSYIRDFIKEKMEKWSVEEDLIFGFYNDQHSPKEQRVGGYNEGRYISLIESNFISQQNHKMGTDKKKSKLYHNEADIALGAMSMRSIVLTLDKKKGPLRDAFEQGGRVLFVNEYNHSQETLGEWIKRKC